MRQGILVAAILGLVATVPAHAGRHEVSGEFGVHNLPSGGATSGLSSDALLGGGIRGGYAVFRNSPLFGLVVRGGWHMGRREGTAFVPSPPMQQQSQDGEVRGIDGRLEIHQIQVGLKADVEVGGFFFPYVAVDAGMVVAGLRQQAEAAPAGEDPYRDGALAPSGSFLLGTDWMIPDRKLGLPVTVAFHVEGGYFVSGPLRFQETGAEQRFAGAVLRAGVGLRF